MSGDNISRRRDNQKNSSQDIESKYNLTSLFAKVFGVYKRTKPGASNVLISKWNDDLDAKFNYLPGKDIAYDKGKPPKIYPITKCKGEGAEKVCEADVNNPNTFSINNRSGKIASDALLGKGVYKANAEFFTWADHNQMPIRRFMVDWREKGMTKSGTVVGKTTGYYFNYKPFCGNNECYEFPVVDFEWSEALKGWIGKEKGLYGDKVEGPVSCDDTSDCETEFQAMIDQKYGTDADYPDLDKLACYQKKCYEIEKPEEVFAEDIQSWYVPTEEEIEQGVLEGWKVVQCTANKTCNIHSVLEPAGYYNVNGEISPLVRINEIPFKNWGCTENLACGDDNKCHIKCDAVLSDTPVIGWIGKKLENYAGDTVLCQDDTDCHNKVNEMMNNGWGDSDDYGPMSMIACYNPKKFPYGNCWKKKVKENAPYEPDKLTGLTCKSLTDFNCPDSTDPLKEQVCTGVGARFGNQLDKSCKEEPAKRVFNYTCDANRFKPDDYKK